MKPKFKVGERVRFTWAGKHYNKLGTVYHVRKDGCPIVTFDADPPGNILVVQPYEIDKAR